MSIVTKVAIRLSVSLGAFVALFQMGPGFILLGAIGSIFAVSFPSLSRWGALALGLAVSYFIIFLIIVVIPPLKRRF
jgi:hypothetical protein